MTKMIIAQRITSVMHTDQIVILDDGQVHAVGTHRELLADDPIYQEIYASQMKGGDGHGDGSSVHKKPKNLRNDSCAPCYPTWAAISSCLLLVALLGDRQRHAPTCWAPI